MFVNPWFSSQFLCYWRGGNVGLSYHASSKKKKNAARPHGIFNFKWWEPWLFFSWPKLQSEQNQLLKVLYNKDWRYGTNVLHSECELVKVRDLYEIRILSFVRKCLNKETISLFHKYFTFQHSQHDHNTRLNLDLVTPRPRTDSGATRVQTVGSKLWNSNDTAKQYLNFSIDTFKHKLKDFFYQFILESS